MHVNALLLYMFSYGPYVPEIKHYYYYYYCLEEHFSLIDNFQEYDFGCWSRNYDW